VSEADLVTLVPGLVAIEVLSLPLAEITEDLFLTWPPFPFPELQSLPITIWKLWPIVRIGPTASSTHDQPAILAKRFGMLIKVCCVLFEGVRN